MVSREKPGNKEKTEREIERTRIRETVWEKERQLRKWKEDVEEMDAALKLLFRYMKRQERNLDEENE